MILHFIDTDLIRTKINNGMLAWGVVGLTKFLWLLLASRITNPPSLKLLADEERSYSFHGFFLLKGKQESVNASIDPSLGKDDEHE